jgi:hypothetical protein
MIGLADEAARDGRSGLVGLWGLWRIKPNRCSSRQFWQNETGRTLLMKSIKIARGQAHTGTGALSRRAIAELNRKSTCVESNTRNGVAAKDSRGLLSNINVTGGPM